jgi:hypothetical protein
VGRQDMQPLHLSVTLLPAREGSRPFSMCSERFT